VNHVCITYGPHSSRLGTNMGTSWALSWTLAWALFVGEGWHGPRTAEAGRVCEYPPPAPLTFFTTITLVHLPKLVLFAALPPTW
jgi:hypothetical protein